MTHALSCLALLYVASAFRQPTPAQPQQPRTVAPACRACDDVVLRVLPLLPRTPVAVKVIDLDHSARVLQEKFKKTEGFVTTGDPAVYLTKQGSTFQHALRGPGIWDYALAIIIWHEMAHLEGANERQARQKEEELWAQFVEAGRVDTRRGIAYLVLLRKRP
jgi:hypothetical protein